VHRAAGGVRQPPAEQFVGLSIDGQAVQTSIDPKVQRAAEAALASEHRNVAMVAIDASTGQILAVVSDPVSDAYDQSLQGEYPPGSTAPLSGGGGKRGQADCSARR
jgi:cell division protein FtsI/penicillin-binding protein 2